MKQHFSRRVQILHLLIPVAWLLVSLFVVVHYSLQSREHALLKDRLAVTERSWNGFLFASQRLISSGALGENIDAWIETKNQETARYERFLAPESLRRYRAADPSYGEWIDRMQNLYEIEAKGLTSLEGYLRQLQSLLAVYSVDETVTLLELVRFETVSRYSPSVWFSAFRALEEINTATVLVQPAFNSLFTSFREEMNVDLDRIFRRQSWAVVMLFLSGLVLIALLFYFRYRQIWAELAASRIAEEEALRLQERLELRVEERTAELEEALEEYSRINAELEATNRRLEEALETIRVNRDAMIQQEKLAALGQLVAGLAHEINTPLGVSLTAATFLRQRLSSAGIDDDARLNESADLLVRNLDRSVELVRYFKQLAADQTGMPRRTFDLVEYITTLAAGLRPQMEAAGATLTLILPDELLLDSYPGVFSFTAGSLIKNALEHGYAAGGGEIIIEVTLAADTLTMSCRDFGRGISPADQKRIFIPFYTSNRGAGSSGLGLSIAHNYVTRILGGDLRCSSEPGRGALFLLTVPIRRDGEHYRTV